MTTNWRDYCQIKGFVTRNGGVEVQFDNGRKQQVEVEDQGDVFLVRSIVARRGSLEGVPDVALLAWVRNRSLSLVGFRLDERGRMIGEAWIPKAGLVDEEFQLIVRHVAAEADRFEFQLTGQDQE